MKKKLVTIFLSISPTVIAQEINQSVTSYSVSLGSTRVVYNDSSKGESILISNSNVFPVLAQSAVFDESGKKSTNFIVTPPIFRLDENQQSRVRVIENSHTLPRNKESMYWLCVTGIPPEINNKDNAKDKKTKASLEISIIMKQCIKVFYRPSGLKDTPERAAENLEWKLFGGNIISKNATPYYMNFKEIFFNGERVDTGEYQKPFTDIEIKLKSKPGKTNEIKWKVINDIGGESKLFKKIID